MHTEMPLYQIVKKGTVNLNKLLRLDMVVAFTHEELQGGDARLSGDQRNTTLTTKRNA